MLSWRRALIRSHDPKTLLQFFVVTDLQHSMHHPPNHPPRKRPLKPLSFIYLLPSMGTAELRKLLEENQKGDPHPGGTPSIPICVHIAFIIWRS